MKINVAIANSHQIFRKSLTNLLEDKNNTRVVLECSDGDELLEKIITYPEINVLVLDIQMPGIDGLTCCETLQAKRPEIDIIILSHLQGEHYLKSAIKLGVHGYFTKDSDSNDLLTAIRKSGDGGFYFEKKLKSKIDKIFDHIKRNPTEDNCRYDFSKRELEVIYLTALEFKSKEIADKLNISPRTVEGHKNNLTKKTKSKSFLGVILMAVELRLISLDNDFRLLSL